MAKKPKLTQRELRQVVQSTTRAQAKGGKSVSAKSITRSRTDLEAAVLRRRATKPVAVSRPAPAPRKKLPLRPKKPRDPFKGAIKRAGTPRKKR